MIDEQVALGNAGAPFEIEWRGKKYTFSFFTQKVKAKLIRWAKQQVILELDDLREVIGEEKYESEREKHIDDCKKGKFHFESEYVQDLLKTFDGKIELIRAMLGDNAKNLSEPDLVSLITDRWDEIENKISSTQSSVEDLLKEAGFDIRSQEEKIKSELCWPTDGTEPTSEQTENFKKRMQLYQSTIDPKVKSRCLLAAGIMG